MNKFLLLLLLVPATWGCTHAVHLSHIDDIQPFVHSKDAVRLRSEATQFTILGFVTQTDYVNQAYNKLVDQCSKGAVTGINTRYSTTLGFFSWTNKINMSGWCVAQP